MALTRVYPGQVGIAAAVQGRLEGRDWPLRCRLGGECRRESGQDLAGGCSGAWANNLHLQLFEFVGWRLLRAGSVAVLTLTTVHRVCC